MKLEVDPVKSASNLREHGIDFADAQALWEAPDRLEIPARSIDEPRVQVIGRMGHRIWSAFKHEVQVESASFPSEEHAKKKKPIARSEPLCAARLDALHDATQAKTGPRTWTSAEVLVLDARCSA